MKQTLYMLYDKVAQTTVGNVLRHGHDAPAIRTFHDTLGQQDSGIAVHAEDYDLIAIGTVDDQGLLLPMLGDSPRVVATGAAWKEAQRAANTPHLLTNAETR